MPHRTPRPTITVCDRDSISLADDTARGAFLADRCRVAKTSRSAAVRSYLNAPSTSALLRLVSVPQPRSGRQNEPLRRVGVGLTLCQFCADIPRLNMVKKNAARKRMSRQAQRDLDLEIGFIEGVLKRDPHFETALQVLGNDYTQRGRYVDGLKIDEQLIRLRPDDAVAHYNLACSYSLTDQYDQAVAALDRALSLGYSDYQWLARDPDLQKLRKHPLFTRIRDKVKTLLVKGRKTSR